jgi:hypothetical protein
MRRLRYALALAFALAATFSVQQFAAADDLFTVSGIHVDASAASSSAAQLAALAQGRPKAWAILYKRVTRAQDATRQPQLDDAALQRIIRTFNVSGEKRSTTRYVATVSYSFSPDAVQRVLQSVAVAFTQSQAKRILVIPFAPNYSHSSGWAAALSSPRFATSVVPFSLPGGAVDQSTLGGLSFDSATWADVEPAASRIRSNEAVLMMAAPNGNHLTVTLKRLGAGQLPAKSSVDVALAPGGAPATYSIAADAAVHALEEMWKAHSAVDFSQTGHLTADVRIASLAQWGSLQTTMASTPNVSGVAVQAMDIGEARVTLTYLGSTDQLREALSAQGISLTSRGGEWTLSTSGTP